MHMEWVHVHNILILFMYSCIHWHGCGAEQAPHPVQLIKINAQNINYYIEQNLIVYQIQD